MGLPVEPFTQQSKPVKPCRISGLSSRLVSDPIKRVFGMAGVLARNVFVGGEGQAHPV